MSAHRCRVCGGLAVMRHSSLEGGWTSVCARGHSWGEKQPVFLQERIA